MTSLLDIGDLTEEVELHGVTLTVQGLTAGHIFQLFSEFPDIRKLFDKDQTEGNPQAVMLSLAPDLIAKIIALVTEPDPDKRKAVEARAKRLGADDQLVILAAMQRLSFPEGIGPFVERIKAMTAAASVGLATQSDNSSNSTTGSPPPFSASLQTDTPAGMRGHQRRVN